MLFRRLPVRNFHLATTYEIARAKLGLASLLAYNTAGLPT